MDLIIQRDHLIFTGVTCISVQKFYFESIAIIILPYAGLVMITPTRTPRMVTMANPRRVERSIRASGNIAMNIVDAETMIIPSARFNRLRYRFGEGTLPS